MSTATEIARLSGARDTIRDKLIEFGLAVAADKLDLAWRAEETISSSKRPLHLPRVSKAFRPITASTACQA